MQIIQTTGLITINATLIVQLISFLLFLFVINRLMLRPLCDIMGERNGYMERMRQDAIAAEEKLLEHTRQIEKRRDLVKSEALAAIKNLEDEGRLQAHDLLISTSREINELREKAEKEINDQIDEARKSLFAESKSLAVCLMEQVLKRRVAQ